MMNVLVVVSGEASDSRVLEQVMKLTEKVDATVHVFMSIYDPVEELNKYVGFDDYPKVKQAILDEAEVKLRRLTEQYGDSVTSDMRWGRLWHRNVIEEANKIDAELVVKAIGKHSRISEFLQTPEDWHLLRETKCLVWFVNQSTTRIEQVVAAVNTLDESLEHRQLASRVLDRANDFAHMLGVSLRVVTVVPNLTATQDLLVNVPILLSDYQEKAVQGAKLKLGRLLDELGVKPQFTEVRCGATDVELGAATADNGLLVIGSVANRGLSGKLIGNTSEKVLHYLTGDVVVVH